MSYLKTDMLGLFMATKNILTETLVKQVAVESRPGLLVHLRDSLSRRSLEVGESFHYLNSFPVLGGGVHGQPGLVPVRIQLRLERREIWLLLKSKPDGPRKSSGEVKVLPALDVVLEQEEPRSPIEWRHVGTAVNQKVNHVARWELGHLLALADSVAQSVAMGTAFHHAHRIAAQTQGERVGFGLALATQDRVVRSRGLGLLLLSCLLSFTSKPLFHLTGGDSGLNALPTGVGIHAQDGLPRASGPKQPPLFDRIDAVWAKHWRLSSLARDSLYASGHLGAN